MAEFWWHAFVKMTWLPFRQTVPVWSAVVQKLPNCFTRFQMLFPPNICHWHSSHCQRLTIINHFTTDHCWPSTTNWKHSKLDLPQLLQQLWFSPPGDARIEAALHSEPGAWSKQWLGTPGGGRVTVAMCPQVMGTPPSCKGSAWRLAWFLCCQFWTVSRCSVYCTWLYLNFIYRSFKHCCWFMQVVCAWMAKCRTQMITDVNRVFFFTVISQTNSARRLTMYSHSYAIRVCRGQLQSQEISIWSSPCIKLRTLRPMRFQTRHGRLWGTGWNLRLMHGHGSKVPGIVSE